MNSHKLTPEFAKTALLAGKATITLKNSASGNHFTYTIKRAKDRNSGEPANTWFVSVLSGPDNTNNYRYAGTFFSDMRLVTTQRSKISADAPSFRVFRTVLTQLFNNILDPAIEIWHEGACCKCGRKLTHPESLETGMGPECIKMRVYRK